LGNPNARGVLKRDKYSYYVECASMIIDRAIEKKHEGVLKALAKIDSWMDGKVFFLCHDVLKAQKSKGVSSKELLAEIAGLFLFYQIADTKELPSLRHQLGISILRYKRAAPRAVSYLERKHFGRNLFDVFLPLMRNIYNELKKAMREKKELEAAFSASIGTT